MSELDRVEEYCRALGVEREDEIMLQLPPSSPPEASTFIHLDGGTLHLGLVRDSVLSDDRSFEIFGETFE